MSEEASLDDFTGEESTFGPERWETYSLGDLAEYQNGNAFSKSEWGDTGYPIIRIQNLTGEQDEFNYYEGELEERYQVNTGDTLLSWSATIDLFQWEGPKAALNQHIFRVDSSNSVNDTFYRFKLEHLLPQLEALSHGSTMKHVRKADLVNVDTKIPPLQEQRKIATVLYTVDQAIQKTEEAVEQYDRIAAGLQQTLLRDGLDSEDSLQSTPTGRYPSSWELVRAGDYINLRNGEFLPKDDREEEGKYPVYGGNGVMGYTDEATVERSTLVIGRVGAYCGNVHTTNSDAWVTDNSIIVSELGDEYLPDFLAHLLDEVELGQFSEQSAQPRISQSTIENLRIPKPPIGQQSEIVEKLDSVQQAKQTEENYSTQIKRLKQGLMQDLLSGTVRTHEMDIDISDEVLAHG